MIWKWPDTTDGNTTSGTKEFIYRDWKVTPSNLYYKGKRVIAVVHNVVLVSDSVKFLIPTLVKVNPVFFLIGHAQVEDAENFFSFIFERFISAAKDNHFIPQQWFRMVKKSSIPIDDKFLQHCLKLNYTNFYEVARKRRSRRKSDTEVLSGLWYQHA